MYLIQENLNKKLSMINLLLMVLILSSCKTVSEEAFTTAALEDHQNLTPTSAIKYSRYALMASNSYHNKKNLFPFDQSRYKIEPINDWLSDLQYDILEIENSDEIVIAYRGTNSFWDYYTTNLSLVSLQAELAHYHLKKLITKYKDQNKTIVLVGHSLGGGLAIGLSLREGVKAVAFNPSPRLFDAFGLPPWNYNKPAERIIIYQEGEILDTLRKLSIIDNARELVKKENIYKTRFKFEKCTDFICNHEIYSLAKNILLLALQDKDKDENYKELEKICSEINCN